jgi:phage shock protein E
MWDRLVFSDPWHFFWVMDLHTVVWILIIFGVVFWMMSRTRGDLSMKDAVKKVADGAQIIDVRTRAEFSSGHVADAINIPLDQLGSTVEEKLGPPSGEVLCYCQSGMRSSMAARTLKNLGYTAFNLGSVGRARQIRRQVSY